MKGIPYKNFYVLIILLAGLFSSCEQGSVKGNTREMQLQQPDSSRVDTISRGEVENLKPPLRITYRLDSITDVKTTDSLWERYTTGQQRMLLAINRIESVRVGPGSRLVIPDSLVENFNEYAPFPAEMEILSPISKTVLISRRVQAFGLYECGRLIRWGPVSTGKQTTPTPAGLNYGNFKAKRKVSTVNQSWIMPYYFNFMNFEGVGVHQYLLPGFPASHACVRLDMADAMFIFDWAQQWQLDPGGTTVVKNGTPFMVFGDYDFEDEVPWLQLVKDPAANDIIEEELNILEEYVEDYLRDKRNFKDAEFIESSSFLAT